MAYWGIIDAGSCMYVSTFSFQMANVGMVTMETRLQKIQHASLIGFGGY